jgi:hypothetical protein
MYMHRIQAIGEKMIPEDTPIGTMVRTSVCGYKGRIIKIIPPVAEIDIDGTSYTYNLDALELVNHDTMKQYLEDKIKDAEHELGMMKDNIDGLLMQLDEQTGKANNLNAKKEAYQDALIEYMKQFKGPT